MFIGEDIHSMNKIEGGVMGQPKCLFWLSYIWGIRQSSGDVKFNNCMRKNNQELLVRLVF